MGFIFNGIPGAEVNITGGVGLPTPLTGQTLKQVKATGTGANQTLATITAGKTGYLYSLVSRNSANGETTLKTDGDVDILIVTVPANNTIVVTPGMPIASYAAGENIRVLAPNTASISICYWEE